MNLNTANYEAAKGRKPEYFTISSTWWFLIDGVKSQCYGEYQRVIKMIEKEYPNSNVEVLVKKI